MVCPLGLFGVFGGLMLSAGVYSDVSRGLTILKGLLMAEEQKGFWHTLPGIITAVAGLLGAIGGLLTILNQAGFIHFSPAVPSTEVAKGQSTTAPSPTSPAPNPAPAPKPATAPEPAAKSDSGLVPVPNIVGMRSDDAAKRLQENQLKLGRKSLMTTGRGRPDVIYGQKTVAGARIPQGSAIDVYVEREKLPGIDASGRIFLVPTQVLDLDSERPSARTDFDIRFYTEGASERYLEVNNGAAIASVGRSSVDAQQCAGFRLTTTPVKINIGDYLCVRTSRGRFSLLRVEDLASELELSFDTWSSDTRSGSAAAAETKSLKRVSLTTKQSYDFSSDTKGELSGGDLYVSIDASHGAVFWANNRWQRGLIDLGDIGATPLESVSTPKTGYYQFGVPAVAGHVYASLANRDAEGHFIVFRVDQVLADSVTLSFVYR